MACEIEYKGKVYDFAEFANMLHNGLLDEFIKDGYVKNVKTIESIRGIAPKKETEVKEESKVVVAKDTGITIFPPEMADQAESNLVIVQSRKYYTLWLEIPFENRTRYTYLTTLSTNIDEARNKANAYIQKLKDGKKLSVAFDGKDRADIGSRKSIALREEIIPEKELNKRETYIPPGLDSKLGFGKYANKTINEVIESDINYAFWLSENAQNFKIRELIKSHPSIQQVEDIKELESERIKAFEERQRKREAGENVPIVTLVRGEGGKIVEKSEETAQTKKPIEKKERRIVKDQIKDIVPPNKKAEDNVRQELKPKMFQSQIDGANTAIQSMNSNGVVLNGDGAGVGKTRQIIAVSDYYAQQGKPVVIISENAAIGKPWDKAGSTPKLGGSMEKDSNEMGVKINLLTGEVKDGQIYISTYNRIKEGDIPEGAIVIFDESQNLANTFGRSPGASDKEEKQWEAKFKTILGKAQATAFYSATPADKPHQLAYLHKILGFNTPEEFLKAAVENGTVIKTRKFGREEFKYYDVPSSSVKRKKLYDWVNSLMVNAGKVGRFIKREISYEGTDVQFHDVKGTDESQNKFAELFNDVIQQMSIAQNNGYKLLAPNSYILYAAELTKIGEAIKIAKREKDAGRKIIIFVSRIKDMEIRGRIKQLDGTYGEPEVVGNIPSPVNILKKELENSGITFVELHGSSKMSSQKAQKEFNENADALVASLESGGTGINLDDTKGDSPRTEIFMFSPYRGISTIQGMGRTWRASTIQNDNKPNRYIFVTASDISPDIARSGVLAKKLQLMDAAIGGTAVSKLPMSKVNYDVKQLVGVELPDEGEESSIEKEKTGILKPVEIEFKKSQKGNLYAEANADLLEWYERGGVERTGLNINIFKGDNGKWIAISDKQYSPEEFAPEGINTGVQEDTETVKTTEDAVQKPSTEEVLSRQQGEAGKTGGVGEGMGQGKQGKEAPKASKEEVTSPEATVALDEETEALVSGLAAERRAKGKYTADGVTYTRNEKGQGILSEQGGEVRFTREPGGGGVVVPFRYKLVEAETVQPSHQGGIRNPNFFIPEAQPKNRNDQASLDAEDSFATNPEFSELGEDSSAYKGAPVVNDRGEVIQGNNRAAGLKSGYKSNNPKYKQDLANNAEKFGFTKEQVEGMKNPMLVREVVVNDQKAIELGNYDVKDLETAGKRRIDPITLAARLPLSVKESLAKLIVAGETIKESIKDNADEIFALIRPYINTAIANTILSNGKLNTVGVEDVENVFTQFLFRNGDANLPQMYEGLPSVQREGLKKALPYILSAGVGKSIISDIQEAIMASHYFNSSGASTFGEWANKAELFTDNKAPKDIYTPLALKIAEILNTAKTASEIAGVPTRTSPEPSSFAKYSQLTKGTEGGLFGEAKEGVERGQAVKEVFEVEYTPRKEYASSAKFEESLEKQRQLEKEKAEKEKAKQTRKEIKGKLKELEAKTNAVSDFLRNNLKIKPKEWLDKDGNPIKITKSGINSELWNEIVDGIADLIDSGVELSKAVSQYLKQQDWFKNLSKDNQKAVIDQTTEAFKEGQQQAKQQEAKATTQEAKDALSNFRKIMSRALNGKINEDTRSALNEREKTYVVEPMNPVEQEKRAKELIEKHGMDNLLEDVMSGKINGSVATLIWGVSLKMLGADYKALKESGLDEEAKIIARKQADLIDTYDNLARELGRQLNALKVVYEISEEAFHYYAQRKIRGINAMQIAGLESKIEEIKQELDKVKKFASSRIQTDVELERAINKKRNTTTQRTQLSENEKKRKSELNAELKKDFGGIFMDINQVVPQVLKLVKDERFREYAKLVIKDVNYDFKKFSKQILDNVNKAYKKALKPFIFQIYRDAGGKDSGIEYEKESALKDRIQEELGKSMSPSVTEKVMKALTEANKGLWGKYKKQAAQNIVSSLASLENQRESNTALDLFIKGLVKNFKGELANKEEKAAAEKRSDIDILRDVFQNTEKYEQVLLKAREQFLEKYDPNEEGISIEKRQERIEALAKLDDVIGRVYEQPFSDVLVSNAVSDIVGKSIKSFVYLKAKGFKGIEQLKEDVIEKIIFQTGLIREEAEALVNSIEKDLNAKIKAGQDKFDAEVESARQRVKEAASVAKEKKKANLPVWKTRRDNAIQALKEKLKSRVMDKIPQQKLALEEFTKRLKGNINSSINEAIKRDANEITKKDNVDALVEILNNKDKYSEVLEKTADEIRKEYKDDPYMLNLFEQALYGISENPFNKKTADLATRQALRSVIGDEYTTELMNIAKDYYEGDTKVKGELLNYLVDKTGLDRDYLAPIAKEIEDAYDRIVKGYVENATERIFGTKEKPTIAKIFEGRKVKQTIEAINVALRNAQYDPNFDFAKIISDKFGLIDIENEDVKTALDGFAKKIFASKDAPLYKQIAMIQLEDWLANRQQESKVWEIFKAQSYANMLYDISTHIKNTVFNIPQSFFELGLTGLTNPKYAMAMARQFSRGISEGMDEAASIITTGYPKSTERPAQRAFSERRTAELDANKAMKSWGLYASIPTRFLAALDSALLFPLKRGVNVAYMANQIKADFEKQNPGQRISKSEVITQIENALDGVGAYSSKFQELRNLSEKQTKEFYGIPESQPLFDANGRPVYSGKDKNEVYRNFRRNFYLLKQSNIDVVSQTQEKAEELASKSLLTGIPTGNAFLFYKFAMWFGKYFGLVKLVESPFIKVPLNLVNQAIEASPLGFYNAITGREGFAPEEWARTQGSEVVIDPVRRRNIMAKATAATLGMMGVYALTRIRYDDDDEGERPVLIVYGDGTGNYRKNEKIKRLSGYMKYEPYTIDFMGTRISYQDSPLKTLFLPAGFIGDQERYGDTGDIPERELSMMEQVVAGTSGLFLYIKDMSAVQGLFDLFNVGERARYVKEEEKIGDAMKENLKIQGAKTLRNVIVPNIVPGQYRQYKGFMDMAESARPKNGYDRIFKDIPYFDQFVDKKYDHFGKPINERWKFPGLYIEPTDGNTMYDIARRKGYLDRLKYFNSAQYQALEGPYALDDKLIENISRNQATYAGYIFDKYGLDKLDNLSKEEFKDEANNVFELAKDIAAANSLYANGMMSKENYNQNAYGLSFILKNTYGIKPSDLGLPSEYND